MRIEMSSFHPFQELGCEIFIPAMKSYVSIGPMRAQGVSHCGLAIYITKYLKAKEEELWKLNYISPFKNIIFKKSSKRNQNPSRYYNSMTILKFQHKPKIPSFKNPHIKIDLLLLPSMGQNPLSYYTL
jgi:hypothetical protein